MGTMWTFQLRRGVTDSQSPPANFFPSTNNGRVDVAHARKMLARLQYEVRMPRAGPFYLRS
jgi:prolyl oligopeptidase PreP (S9A serine peptidase family)